MRVLLQKSLSSKQRWNTQSIVQMHIRMDFRLFAFVWFRHRAEVDAMLLERLAKCSCQWLANQHFWKLDGRPHYCHARFNRQYDMAFHSASSNGFSRGLPGLSLCAPPCALFRGWSTAKPVPSTAWHWIWSNKLYSLPITLGLWPTKLCFSTSIILFSS